MCLRAIYLRHQKLSLFHFHWVSTREPRWTRQSWPFRRTFSIQCWSARNNDGITKCGNFYLMKIMIILLSLDSSEKRKAEGLLSYFCARWESKKKRSNEIIELVHWLVEQSKLLDFCWRFWLSFFFDGREISRHHRNIHDSLIARVHTREREQPLEKLLGKSLCFRWTEQFNTVDWIRRSSTLLHDLPLNWISLSLLNQCDNEP